MAVDLSVFSKLKTKADFDREAEAFTLNKLQKQAEIRKLNKPDPLDVDKLGEMAFFKAAQGMELSPQEQAAAAVVDAKRNRISFDPATGEKIYTPSISESLGLGGNVNARMPVSPPRGGGGPVAPMGDTLSMSDFDGMDISLPAGQPRTFSAENPVSGVQSTQLQPQNPWEEEYRKQLAAAAGNPKLQQTLRENYAKSKIAMNASEATNAGYADRLYESDAILADPNVVAAGMDSWQRGLGSIPLVGNYLTSKDYQKFDQARRNYTTAKLRPESGASIAPSEWSNMDEQYFPKPGDYPEALAQKAQNRATANTGVARAAGPAYVPNVIQPVKTQPKKVSPSKIPMDAVRELRAAIQSGDQTAIDEFEQAFGQGAAKMVLNGK